MRRLLVRRIAFAFFVALIPIAQVEAREAWRVWKSCRLLPNAANDGDSFHVRAGNEEFIFRLYFVDAPETDLSFPQRVSEQAKYFHLTQTQTLQLGDYAKHFVQEQLSEAFTVRTCMQDALGRSRSERFYAFVETRAGDLGELLVANGMARVHGSSALPEGLNSPERERQKLRQLERDAETAKVGAWGVSVGRLTARLPKQPTKTGPDSFDAFFHPKKFVSPTPAPSVATSGPLDPNTATSEQLLALPGIGPVLAQRIIEARPFADATELRRVKGIGEKKLEKLRPYFISGAAQATIR